MIKKWLKNWVPSESERARLESIRLSTPGPVARHFNKRISLPISFILAKLRIHPNWITLGNMLVGFSSGWFVAQGTYRGELLGGGLFQLASILDGCDGEVAKLNQKTSKTGEILDTIGDNGSLLSFFTGLLIAYGKSHPLTNTAVLTIALLSGLGFLYWQILVYLKRHTQSASLASFDKTYISALPLTEGGLWWNFVRYGRIFLRKDAFSLLFFLTALAGWLPVWLPIAAIGIWMANICLWVMKWQNGYARQENSHF